VWGKGTSFVKNTHEDKEPGRRKDLLHFCSFCDVGESSRFVRLGRLAHKQLQTIQKGDQRTRSSSPLFYDYERINEEMGSSSPWGTQGDSCYFYSYSFTDLLSVSLFAAVVFVQGGLSGMRRHRYQCSLAIMMLSIGSDRPKL
jgi:hypothetical protein